ncbi:MAG: response regulator [Saprospiraceae bacterium]|nr:response regulator [Saprospiraceae bacterium]
MDDITILWADDEIKLLKPQIIYLEKKGYNVITVSNGHDALEEVEEHMGNIDVIFLDENMPGVSGLDTLPQIKEILPNVPVVMITKNEEEGVMEQAIGAQINDYLIKPVNPVQILTSIRKLIDSSRLVREQTATDYQQEFRKIFMEINSGLDYNQWADIYKKIIHWELKLDNSKTVSMSEILSTQKEQANSEFSKFVERNYLDWIESDEDAPVMSHDLLRSMVFPDVNEERPTFFLLLDNLRYDQWKMIEPIVTEYFRIEEEDYFYSILPTTTQYSRNSIFAGLMPSEIEEYFPDCWLNDKDKGGKNMHEEKLLGEQIRRTFRKNIKFGYQKITTVERGKHLVDNIRNYLNNDFTAIVYNFIDMLSHARTEMEILKELASDEKAYRSLTRSWFEHSSIWEALKIIAEHDVQLFIATDHGSIRVHEPTKVVGDRETTTNLRYKVGKNLQYNRKDVLDVRNPVDAKLPTPNVSSTFIFAKNDKFFLYPNNYNHYNKYYKNTFQHGGISLEEVIIPIVKLRSKKV